MVQLGRIILRHVINYTVARDQLHHIASLMSYLDSSALACNRGMQWSGVTHVDMLAPTLYVLAIMAHVTLVAVDLSSKRS